MELTQNQKRMWVHLLKRIIIALIAFFQAYIITHLINSFFEIINTLSLSLTGKPTIVINSIIFLGMFASIYYFMIIFRYFSAKVFFQNILKKQDQKNELICEELEQFVKSNNLIQDHIKFYEFTDKVSSFNAQFIKPNIIFLGKDLNEKATISEKKFVIGHELSHSLSQHTKKLLPYILFIGISLFGLSYLQFIPVEFSIIFIIVQIFTFFFTIFVFNSIFWQEEYFADKNALKMTNDPKSAISFFLKADAIWNEIIGEDDEPDHSFLNMFLFDHPLSKYRIRKINYLDDDSIISLVNEKNKTITQVILQQSFDRNKELVSYIRLTDVGIWGFLGIIFIDFFKDGFSTNSFKFLLFCLFFIILMALWRFIVNNYQKDIVKGYQTIITCEYILEVPFEISITKNLVQDSLFLSLTSERSSQFRELFKKLQSGDYENKTHKMFDFLAILFIIVNVLFLLNWFRQFT